MQGLQFNVSPAPIPLPERVWGYAHDGGGHTVDSHVARLRRKHGPLDDRIVTVWGVGYRFVDRPD